VRGAFICETPLLSDILKPLERKSEAKISGIRPSEIQALATLMKSSALRKRFP
jgi:hypothetical protein